VKKNKFWKIGHRGKISLLILQILLPFVLYIALKGGNRPLEALIGIVLALSMLVLILFE